ncbi:hypothetical protein LCGC14_0901630 [marine sediment metagenome]|uniref:Uncharacterized protein n=1 Tax=marine sediment metagenome TaxID=412755 RepID=A0A0F9RFE9_9ZZZZ
MKMKYTGPGDDKRTLEVTDAEGKRLIKTGLYKEVVKKAAAKTKKKGAN